MIDHYVTGHMNAAGCIFDGFPRTTVQAEEFDKILAGHGLKVDVMIDIHPRGDWCAASCCAARIRDAPTTLPEEVIRGRLDVYREQTAVVADYYAAQGRRRGTDREGRGAIDGEGKIVKEPGRRGGEFIGARRKTTIFFGFSGKVPIFATKKSDDEQFSINNAWWWRSQFSVVSDSPHAQLVER